MSPKRSSHPTSDSLLQWVLDPTDLETATDVETHVKKCARCKKEIEFLQSVHQFTNKAKFAKPSAELQRKARKMPKVAKAPVAEGTQKSLLWTPPDVRGAGVADAMESQLISHFFPEAEVGLIAVPPSADGIWKLEGRVWLTSPAPKPITLVLAQDDHVLQTIEVADGEFFTLEEVMGPGWRLEMHLPDGPVLTLDGTNS